MTRYHPTPSPSLGADTVRVFALVTLVWMTTTGHAQAQAVAGDEAHTQTRNASHDTTTVIQDGQRIEQITVEDAGSRVDELRKGGETRKITVQPKAGVAAYDVRPPDSGAGSRARNGASGNAGERSWKLLQF